MSYGSGYNRVNFAFGLRSGRAQVCLGIMRVLVILGRVISGLCKSGRVNQVFNLANK